MRRTALLVLFLVIFLGVYIRQDFAQTITPEPSQTLPTITLACTVTYSSSIASSESFCLQLPTISPTRTPLISITIIPTLVATESGAMVTPSAMINPSSPSDTPVATASPTMVLEPVIASPTAVLLASPSGIIFNGPRTSNKIALTFDADMTPWMKQDYERGRVSSWYNARIVDILNQTQTKATLFLSGMWIEMYPNLTRVLSENTLFELANHSYSHPSFDGPCYGLAGIIDTKDVEEIMRTQNLIHNITGKDSKYFRFPGGCYSQSDLAVVESLGIKAIQWDVAGNDGFNLNPLAIVHNVVDRVQNGSIIVLHLHGGPNAPKTADALPEIIVQLRAKGFEFVKLSDLFSQ